MDATALLGVSVAAVTLTAAAILAILRRTRGLSATQRMDFVAGRGASALVRALPAVGPVVGLIVFVWAAVIGVAVTTLIVRAISPQGPRPAEASLLIGDTVLTLYPLILGLGLSLCVAVAAGLMAAKRVTAWRGPLI